MFNPKQKNRKRNKSYYLSTKAGKDLYEKFEAFCDHANVPKSEMLRQMIEYCMSQNIIKKEEPCHE